MRLGLLAPLAVLVAAAAVNAQDKTKVELRAGLIDPGLTVPESDKVIHGIRLFAEVDKAGEGSGTLELDPTVPKFDEFGYLQLGEFQTPVKLEFTLKFVKKGKVRVALENRIGGPEADVEWALYEVRGPKITRPLVLAIPTAEKWKSGRLLIHNKDGKVEHSIAVHDPGPPPPCHPGCFPAGTVIHVPGGTRLIERVGEGDLVTTVAPDGKTSQAKVTAVFVTKNRLLEVKTDAGSLLTTETQPLALVDGALRAAGELKAGDRVWRWDAGERRAVTVKSVSATGREERVFNLVLGEPTVFVANGFLARSKPPAVRGE
jgi:hypothetical protein